MDRARILLYKADGMTFQQIADKLAISTATVRLCVSKFHKGGLDAALFDVQRSGRPSEITDDAKAWMISIACQRPAELGYAQKLWTLAFAGWDTGSRSKRLFSSFSELMVSSL